MDQAITFFEKSFGLTLVRRERLPNFEMAEFRQGR